MGWWWGLQPPRIGQIAIFVIKKKKKVIFGKPLDFRASNEKKYSGKRLQPPPPKKKKQKKKTQQQQHETCPVRTLMGIL